MSGHSKWNNIKNKKGAQDAKRGKIFAQLSKQIRIAVRTGGGGDANANPSLRLAVDKARASNMPNENIQRAIDRGLGIGKGGKIEEILYEGYGPAGVGFLVIAQTDNKMRTGAEVRSAFDKNGGSLGGPGSAMYLFERSGDEYVVTIPLPFSSENDKKAVEKIEEALLEIDDVEAIYHNGV